MYRTVATGTPATAAGNQIGVPGGAYVDVSGGTLHLGMAFQTKVRVVFDQQFSIDRAVRAMTNGAAFAHGFVLKNKGTRLFPMTLGATFVLSRHRQAAGGFENIRAVRIVALHAIHFAFENGVVMRELKLGVRFEMALKTGGRLFPRVDDEPATRSSHVFAGRAMARFATGAPR